MNPENKKTDAVEHEPIEGLEGGFQNDRGRWVYHILKIIIGILLYKFLFAAAPYLKDFIKNFS